MMYALCQPCHNLLHVLLIIAGGVVIPATAAADAKHKEYEKHSNQVRYSITSH